MNQHHPLPYRYPAWPVEARKACETAPVAACGTAVETGKKSEPRHGGLVATVLLLALVAVTIVFWIHPVLTATAIALGVIAVATRGLTATGNQNRKPHSRKNTTPA